MRALRNLSQLLLVMILMSVFTYSGLTQNVIKIEHALGTTLVPKNPHKVVVFDYATLDTLDNMGVAITGLPKASIPDYLAQYKDRRYVDVGTLFEPNFERLYDLQPDVIFISSRQSSVYPELAKIAPTVYLAIDNTDYVGSLSHNLRILGEIFEQQEYIERTIDDLEQEFAAIRDKVTEAGLNALLIMVNDGALSAYGPNSRFGVLHKEFGFSPADPHIEVANHGQNISFEYLLKINPDFLFVVDRAATVGGSISARQVLNNAIVKETSAAKNDRIIYLTSQVWYVASGGLTGTRIMIQDIMQALK